MHTCTCIHDHPEVRRLDGRSVHQLVEHTLHSQHMHTLLADLADDAAADDDGYAYDGYAYDDAYAYDGYAYDGYAYDGYAYDGYAYDGDEQHPHPTMRPTAAHQPPRDRISQPWDRDRISQPSDGQAKLLDETHRSCSAVGLSASAASAPSSPLLSALPHSVVAPHHPMGMGMMTLASPAKAKGHYHATGTGAHPRSNPDADHDPSPDTDHDRGP